MKILLLGEYSGVHTNLSAALKKRGHIVHCVHNGDGFKSFQADTFIIYKTISSNSKLLQNIINLYYLVLVYSGLKGVFQILPYIKTLRTFKNYDIVQIINPRFLAGFGPLVNLVVFFSLKRDNHKVFLCALGDDYFWVKYCLDKNFKYSMFDRLSLKTFKKFAYGLQYRYGLFNPYLNKYVAKNVNAIIPGIYDYYVAYKSFDNCSEIVPIIIDNEISKNDKLKKREYPINIFHGWQPDRGFLKGNDLFDKALTALKEKYPSKINYEIVGGIPYDEYVNCFKSSDIFLDQCFSQDCGVNALIGLAEGKAVLSGFEENVKKYYGIDYYPLVNVEPNIEFIYLAVEKIILDPSLLDKYSFNALKFIKDFHSEDYVISKYLKIWKNY